MTYVLLILAMTVGNTDYKARVRATSALRETYPLSAPLMIFGRESPDAETAARCDRLCTELMTPPAQWFPMWGREYPIE